MSWVIRDKESGEVLFETFDEQYAARLNGKYEAVPIGEYLGSLNRPEVREVAFERWLELTE